MHRLLEIIRSVNKTHPHLGPILAVNLVGAIARKCVLNVAPAGMGKSVSSETVADIFPKQVLKYESLTRSSLRHMSKALTGFNGLVVVDDVGAEKTIYSRVATISALAHLVYSHRVSKYTASWYFKIEDFHGSAILNIQPVALDTVINSDDFEAVIRDKTLRYYHFFRPKEPKKIKPKFPLPHNYEIDHVRLKLYKRRLWYDLIRIGLSQWSYARCIEHIPDLLRAVATVDGRNRVEPQDFKLLAKLLKPMQIEPYVFDRSGPEMAIFFNRNLLYLIIEVATHRDKLTAEAMAVDYKMSYRNIQRFIDTVIDWVTIDQNSPQIIKPSDNLKKILEVIGVYDRY